MPFTLVVRFNARAHAANFGIEELTGAIQLWPNILDVAVYVTVNIPP